MLHPPAADISAMCYHLVGLQVMVEIVDCDDTGQTDLRGKLGPMVQVSGPMLC